MGFLGNLIRKKLIKQTSQTIFSVYGKMKKENPNFNEKDILESLIVMRKPYWDCRSSFIMFKNHLAFNHSLLDKLQIGSFIEIINIWESIIVNPNDIRNQSITMRELRDMITDIVNITFEVRGVISASEENSVKDSEIEIWMGYSCETIGRLGGKIYQT